MSENRWDVFSKELNHFVTAITVRTMIMLKMMKMVVLVMSLCLPCRCRACRGQCWCCRTGYTHIEHREESLWIQKHNDHTVDLQNPPDTHTDLHTRTHTHTLSESCISPYDLWRHAPRGSFLAAVSIEAIVNFGLKPVLLNSVRNRRPWEEIVDFGRKTYATMAAIQIL